MMLRTNRSVMILVFTFMLQQEEITPPCHFYARKQEIPSSIAFWRITEKREQVTQNLKACSGKKPSDNIIQVQSEASNTLQDKFNIEEVPIQREK